MFTRTISDRFEIIAPHIKSGEILDLGCVDSRPAKHSAEERIEHKPNMLLKRIFEANKNTLGIDIDPAGIEMLEKLGFTAQCADVETMDLGKRFDTIVAGELIEHLENPGRFLRNMHRHLKPSGTLIISTPNPFYQGQTWKIWRYGKPMVHEDHANWQDPTTLTQLLHRTGFKPFEGYWVQPARSNFKTWKRWFRGYFSHGFMILAHPSDA